MEGDFELYACANEELVEFGFELIEERVIALDHRGIECCFEFLLLTVGSFGGAHLKQADALICGGGFEGTERGLDGSFDKDWHR